MLESQYHKIQEFMQGSIKGARVGISKKKLKMIQNIIDEMNRCKTVVNDLIDFNKNNKINEIQTYLDKLSTDLPNFNM